MFELNQLRSNVVQRRVWHLDVFLLLLLYLSQIKAWRPCPELSPVLRIPCRCNVVAFGSTGQLGAVAMDCDRVVFHGEAPQLPYGAPIVYYSQRHSGQQVLPSQHFGTLKLPVEELDLSHNLIRRLPEKSFNGLRESLAVLRLAHNLLGDSLNPIFSTAELNPLKNLRTLDLSANKIKAIEEGLLKGCTDLKEIYLDWNSLTSVPSNSLNGPTALRHLSLKHNFINIIRYGSFLAQPNLEVIDLRHNEIRFIESLAFKELQRLREIKLAGNRITNLNSDVFERLPGLQKLDLSENFMESFPVIALSAIGGLKYLNLSSNMLPRLDSTYFQVIKNLEILDLSRNGITSIAPGTFRHLGILRYLDLSFNSLRTIEDDALEGLENLQTLILRDNNILLLPGSALGRLAHLTTLQLDYNRVAALSSDILSSIQATEITSLTLSRNVIRELPADSFQTFTNLHSLDLSGNFLASITADIFMGLEASLNELKLGQNHLNSLGSTPLTLTELRNLDLSGNSLSELPKNIFQGLENLQYLNLSGNYRIGVMPMLKSLQRLQILDMSDCALKRLSGDTFATMRDLKHIHLNENQLQEINDGTFMNLWNISSIDLSNNRISSIRPSAFVNVMNIKRLNLRGNQLSAFKGEFFDTGTGLEELDISRNHLTYLFPSSFRIHPRLRIILASFNKFSFFPAELISSLQYLEHIDLSHNNLKTIEELDFARLPRLRILEIAYNQLDMLSEMAFHNSTQLQILDLSYNHLDRIGERTFEGMIRLELLNLENNPLNELPDTLFERSKLQMLENINLAYNQFDYAPLKALQRQYFFVASVNLSHNRIQMIPADDSMMVNIKNLDLSFNPLTKEAIRNILNEPKTVRELNLAGTGIMEFQGPLETPFLQYLNLSHNQLKRIPPEIFKRTTLLESLDLSDNRLEDMSNLAEIWPQLLTLQHLDLSNNSFEIIMQGNLEHLNMLKSLKLNDLKRCSRIEKNAFRHIPNLQSLEAYNLPLLGYLDTQGILELLPALEQFDLEVKDAAIGSEQIQAAKHPRLKEISLRGNRLKSISSGTLAGLRGQELIIRLRNTSISTLPPALLFPVPRSSHLTLDISGSRLPVIYTQFLNSLDDRRGYLTLKGLATNPLHCDCNARALRLWLSNMHMNDAICHSPPHLADKKLTEIGDGELTCDTRKMMSRTTAKPTTATSSLLKSTTKLLTRASSSGGGGGGGGGGGVGTSSTTTSSIPEDTPMIIWSMEPTQTPHMKIKTKAPLKKTPIITNDDTLIIGIVGGVVAFIAILIIIICIVRLRMSTIDYPNGPTIIGIPPLPMGPGSMPLSYKGASPATLYAVPPYAQNYSTLPHKAASLHQSSQCLLPRHVQQQQQQVAQQQQLLQQQQQQQQQQQHHHHHLQQQQVQQQQQQQQQQQAQNHSSRMSYFGGASPLHQQTAMTNTIPTNAQSYIIYPDDKVYK